MRRSYFVTRYTDKDQNGFNRVLLSPQTTPLGWIGVIPINQDRIWEIHPLAVAPAQQGHGYGRMLAQEIERLAAERGGLGLLVETSDKTGATPLYGIDREPVNIAFALMISGESAWSGKMVMLGKLRLLIITEVQSCRAWAWSLQPAAARSTRPSSRALENHLMNFLRQHWFDVGLLLALGVGGFLLFTVLSSVSLVLWRSLIALFLYQFEEYRFPGYFAGMVNLALFASQQPDRTSRGNIL